MGFDCGFDIYPRLEAGHSDQVNYSKFLDAINQTFGSSYDDAANESDKKVLNYSSPVYIYFNLGEAPRMPRDPKWCNYFLRFSSKISGHLTSPAEPYIRQVYEIAKLYLGNRVHFWHEMNEFEDEWQQYGYYNWQQVHEADSELRTLVAEKQPEESLAVLNTTS